MMVKNFISGLVFLCVCLNCGKTPDKVDLNIIFTSSMKGEVRGCSCRKGGGNIAQFVTVYKKNLELYPDHLLLDCGNFATGTYHTEQTKGKLFFPILDEMGMDIVNVTPYDLHYGIEYFKKQAKKTDIEFISTSMVYRENQEHFFQPYQIINKKINGLKLKIGVIGLYEDRFKEVRHTLKRENIEVLSFDEAIKKYAQDLKGRVDILIGLSYTKFYINEDLAKDYSVFDVLISGAGSRYNEKKIGNTIIVQAPYMIKGFGVLSLTVDKEKKIQSHVVRFVLNDKKEIFSEPIKKIIQKNQLNFK